MRNLLLIILIITAVACNKQEDLVVNDVETVQVIEPLDISGFSEKSPDFELASRRGYDYTPFVKLDRINGRMDFTLNWLEDVKNLDILILLKNGSIWGPGHNNWGSKDIPSIRGTDQILGINFSFIDKNRTFRSNYLELDTPMGFIHSFLAQAERYNMNVDWVRAHDINIYYGDTGADHILGKANGYCNNKLVDIVINKSVWDIATMAEKAFIMYHELAHDIFNVDHTSNGLMIPSASIGRNYITNSFFHSSLQTTFVAIRNKTHVMLERCDQPIIHPGGWVNFGWKRDTSRALIKEFSSIKEARDVANHIASRGNQIGVVNTPNLGTPHLIAYPVRYLTPFTWYQRHYLRIETLDRTTWQHDIDYIITTK